MNKDYDLKISVGCKEFHNEYMQLSDYIKDIDELMYLNKQKMKKQLS